MRWLRLFSSGKVRVTRQTLKVSFWIKFKRIKKFCKLKRLILRLIEMLHLMQIKSLFNPFLATLCQLCLWLNYDKTKRPLWRSMQQHPSMSDTKRKLSHRSTHKKTNNQSQLKNSFAITELFIETNITIFHFSPSLTHNVEPPIWWPLSGGSF